VLTEQLVKLPPVAAQRIEQVPVARQPLGAPGRILADQFGFEVPQEEIDFGGCHDGPQRNALRQQLRIAGGIVAQRFERRLR